VCVTVTGGTVAPVGTLSIQGNYTQTGRIDAFPDPARPNGAVAQIAAGRALTFFAVMSSLVLSN
jgi:hypothetical protein